jgi:phage gp29-like protein
MNSADLTRLKRTPNAAEIAGRNSDPRWYAALTVLPNPDPILRKAGKDSEVFDAIAADAHVMGELRSIKADLLRFQHVLVPGDDSRKAAKGLELCQRLLNHDPAPNRSWPNLIWNIGQAVFRGISVHELVWARQGDWLLPTKILDRPQRRFGFDADNQLRLLTRESPVEGIPAEQFYFLLNRHMPSYDNPYGVALFSSCFWPYTFKHAGFRWFVKFCERFGIPFPVGKYPLGTQPDQIRELELALENLIEAGYAALAEGSEIELIQAQGPGNGGQLAQHSLIQQRRDEQGSHQPDAGHREPEQWQPCGG